MSKNTPYAKGTGSVIKPSLARRFIQWVQEPLGSIIAASAAAIGAFGLVLSVTWAIHTVLG